jgi:hypothetical protein
MAMRKDLGMPLGVLRRGNPLERIVDYSDKWHPVVPGKRGGLNWSVQHYLEVYLPEFESPKFVAGVD